MISSKRPGLHRIYTPVQMTTVYMQTSEGKGVINRWEINVCSLEVLKVETRLRIVTSLKKNNNAIVITNTAIYN